MNGWFVGVAGGTGSGKTAIVRRASRILGEGRLAVLECDAYYRQREDLDCEERRRLNFDHPDALDLPLLSEHLELLSRNRSVEVPVYDFSSHRRKLETRTLFPRTVILVEGILVLAIPELRNRMNLRVYVEAPSPVRFARRLKRDVNERGRSSVSVIHQFLRNAVPMHDRFVEPSRAFADLLVDGAGEVEVAAGQLAGKIESLISRSGCE